MPTLTLTYFDSPGRAEPVRLALRIGGVAFNDVRVTFPEFAAAKASGAYPLGFVPVLDVDGVRINETAAILRYAARIGDRTLYPEDPWRALLVDSVIDAINDTFMHGLLPSLFERDAEKKLQMRAAFAAGVMTRVCGYIDGLIGASGGPFVAGEALSVADLMLAIQLDAVRSGRYDGLHGEHLAPWPRLGALTDAVFADPRVAAVR